MIKVRVRVITRVMTRGGIRMRAGCRLPVFERVLTGSGLLHHPKPTLRLPSPSFLMGILQDWDNFLINMTFELGEVHYILLRV